MWVVEDAGDGHRGRGDEAGCEGCGDAVFAAVFGEGFWDVGCEEELVVRNTENAEGREKGRLGLGVLGDVEGVDRRHGYLRFLVMIGLDEDFK